MGPHALHFTEWGDAAARRVIVCAHGYSGNARDFDFLAERLAPDARVVCIDFPGRGDSQWLSTALEYNPMQLAADARQLIGHLGAKRVDWIGTSMGGLVGMMIAGQAGSPIDRLVVNDVGAYLPIDALQAIGRHLDAPESFKSLDAVEAHLRRTRADWGSIDDGQWKAMARHHARPLRPGSDLLRLHFDPRIAQIVRPLPFAPGLSFWDAWYRVRCQVLLLRGEHSEVFPTDVAETMLDVRPDAELVEIADCGHAPSLMTESHVARVRHFLHDGVVESPGRRRDRKPSLPARAA